MTNSARPNSEVELKFDLNEETADKIRRDPLLSSAHHRTRSHNSIYFDTDQRDIGRAGYSLRVRQLDDGVVQTVKRGGGQAGLFDRDEWETSVAEMAPDRDALRQTPLGKFEAIDRELVPVVRSEVERTQWNLRRNGSAIEVAL